MSQQLADFEKSLVCSEDLSAKQFYIVQQDANGLAEVGEGATDLLLGVLQNKPESGEAAIYRFNGTAKVKAGGSVNIGDYVTSDSSGKAVATTSAGNVVIGKALEAASDGDIFEVQLCHFKY